MSQLPSDRVTLLFTDMEGSTRLLHELGDGYDAAMAPNAARSTRRCSASVSARRTGFQRGEAQALTALGYLALLRDRDPNRALVLLEEAAAIAEEAGFRWWLAGICSDIALVLLEARRPAAAEPWACRSLELTSGIRDRRGVVVGLALLAEIAAEAGRHERSGRLWGAVESELERAPLSMFTIWLYRDLRSDWRAAAADDPAFEHGRAAGRELALDAAVSACLASVD